ncbi:MAG: hypothetical protein IT427_08165 [Pirellulales bacterium]|nr:hypothetical protein [Pirellulales bacterium]
MTGSTSIAASTDRGLLERMGSVWTRFWFTPGDPIWLCALRIAVGLVTLWWYLGFVADLTSWFGPSGLFPPEMFQANRLEFQENSWSLLELATTPETVKLFYGIGLVAIVGMTVGYFTRFCTIVTLLVVLSFVRASALMARPIDDVLAMLLFYLSIAPAGACFSLDARSRARRQWKVGASESIHVARLYTTATLATRLMQVHLAIIYATMAISQLQFEAWWQGSAVWWMMARSESRLVDFTGLSRMGMAFVYLVNFLTHFIVFYEICFALLIWNRAIRPILLAFGVLVWLSIMFIHGSPSFCLLMLLANMAFLPPEKLRKCCRTAAQCS